MESVAGQVEALCQGGGPTGLNKLQVTILGRTVDFIPDDGVAGMGGVDADLVGSAGEGFGFDQRKKTEPVFEFFENAKLRPRHRTARVDHALEVDFGIQNLPPADDRGVDRKSLLRRMAVEDR